MLPPVRAALSSNAEYQSQAQATISRARVDVSPNSAQSQLKSDATLSGARFDAASLSAQLKLAQGSSIFAETIGKLLKTPRRENETLIDYTTRLVAAVQALKPQEVANVERLLNQIVKGISLRLMAEILKEPSGPTAARLAAHIEASNLAQRDLAAKTVVSFYRQNASTEVPPNANTARVAQGGNPAAAQANSAVQTSVAAADDQIAVPGQPATNDASSKALEGQSQRSASSPLSPTLAAKPEQSVQVSKPAISQIAVPSQDTPDQPTAAPSSEVAGATKATTPQTTQPAGPQPSSERVENNVDKTATVGTITGNQAQIETDEAARQTATAKPNEMQALARSAVEIFKLEMPVPERLWSSLSDQTLLKLATWLATVLSELDGPETAQTLPPLPTAQTATKDGPVEQQRAAVGQNAQVPSPTSQGTQTPVQAGPVDRPDSARLAAVAVSRGETAEQQMAIMAAALPAVAAREALPWPYVAAYPPADDEPRREQRKTHPIEAIEDEEQDGSTQQQFFDDEQQDSDPEQEDAHGEEKATESMTVAEKAAGYTASEANVEAEAAEARPSDLYWRMAGWN
ncbi:hypothetical protein [Aliirhizobium smilacinae]|uniref:Uncharacterized protein n=1 Tax=Aliirhizobium smilacinae TaxID=1395944 RepID=A0A5C4XTP5_9HYPH|nr:hypothetical protein [Rhizobium smilacinae]TNM66577.1 hypothetical protein FHP24_10410 [Rhizobium smilacinae]